MLLVVVALPTFLYLSRTQQIFREHAQLNTLGPYDSCNKLHIVWQENIVGASSCIQGQANPNVSSYGVTIFIKSNDGQSHSFHYITYKGICPSGNLNPPCIDSKYPVGTEGSMTVSSNAQSIVIPSLSPPVGSKCGVYQDDFVITAIDGNSSCHYGNQSSNIFGSSGPGGAGFCPTGRSCPVPPSITPTPSLTAVPSTKPTPTACVRLAAPLNVKVSCPNC